MQLVLDTVGLGDAGGRRVGTLSLGMRQRLGVAAAILGDPEVGILDEPVNGLDPEGVIWIRTLMRGLAAEGRTVLVSSHLMSEMAQTADHLLVVGRGRLVADVPTDTLLRGAEPAVRVVSPTPDDVWRVLELAGANSPVETATAPRRRLGRGRRRPPRPGPRPRSPRAGHASPLARVGVPRADPRLRRLPSGPVDDISSPLTSHRKDA